MLVRQFCWLPALLMLASISAAAAEKKSKPPAAVPAGPTLAEIDRARTRLAPLHARLGQPAPADWLAAHKENGQTFAEYRRAHPQRQPRSRRTIYIQALGAFSATGERLIDATSDLLGRFYDAEVKRLPLIAGLAIPAEARRRIRTRAKSKSSRPMCWTNC